MSNIFSIGVIYIRYTTIFEFSSNQIDYNPIIFPATISNQDTDITLTVLFETNSTITTNSQYFICGTQNIIFNGDFHTITIDNVSGFMGVFQNGIEETNGFTNVIIKNVFVHSNSSVLVDNGGWLCQSYYSRGVVNNKIEFCGVKGNLTHTNQGGICGVASFFMAQDDSENFNYITNCFFVGSITGGGICGSNCAWGGKIQIINCYSIGNIANYSGGICSSNAGSNEGNCVIKNCYSTGDIAYQAGGIVGTDVANTSGNCSIINCYSSGEITGGGIVGWLNNIPSDNGIINVSNCYASGLTNIEETNGLFANVNEDYTINITSSGSSVSWYDSDAITYLLNVGNTLIEDNVWIDIHESDYPYLLYGSHDDILEVGGFFNKNFYDGTIDTTITQGNYSNLTLSDIAGNLFFIVPSTLINPSVSAEGQLTSNEGGIFNLIIANSFFNGEFPFIYNLYGYNFINFTLTVEASKIKSSAIINLYSKKQRKKDSRRIKKYIEKL
jgi:hypothetical protein